MLEAVLNAVRAVAREEVMPRYLSVTHQRKSDGSLLTQADLAAQEALTRELRKIVDCPLLGEEMTERAQHDIWGNGTEHLWCVDPIDGTTNFVNGLPYFAMSIALLCGRRPVLGVVYDPVADEMFYAGAGGGAFLNGERLPFKEQVPPLKQAVAEVDFKRLSPNLARSLAEHPPYASQRNFGACALDWCYLAAGRVDVYLHGGQMLWDYAAGCLILAEAGGAMCTLDNDDFWSAPLWKRSAIAGFHPAIFAQWKDWVRRHQ